MPGVMCLNHINVKSLMLNLIGRALSRRQFDAIEVN